MSTIEQGFFYDNGTISENQGGFRVTLATTGLNAHLNLLEDFSPLRNADPFRWIPQGLFYDLVDDRNDRNAVAPPRVDLNDIVSGFTNQQLFNSLNNNVSTLQLYRLSLMSQTNNNQSATVNNLFNFYGY